MVVHAVDGTYELFRHFYGQRSWNKGKDKPFGAVAGVLHSVLEMIETGAMMGAEESGGSVTVTLSCGDCRQSESCCRDPFERHHPLVKC